MGLQLEIPTGRALTVKGSKKVIHNLQHISDTTHSYTIQIQMCASGKLSSKLPVVLYELVDVPKRAREQLPDYSHLHVYSCKADLSGSEIAKLWMKDIFLELVDPDSVLVIDSWSGYEQMLQIPQIAGKRLNIVTLPPGTASVLQPADVYFNRPFKDFIRKVCNKIRWQNNGFDLAERKNFLSILDMIYYQFKAQRFEPFLKYAWYRAGYTQEHPTAFSTPAQFCLGAQGYIKCENKCCTEFCLLRCAHCARHYCFRDALEHRDNMDC